MTRLFFHAAPAVIACTLFATVAGCSRSEQTEGEARQGAATDSQTAADGSIQLAGGEARDGAGITTASYTEDAVDPFHQSLHALQPLQTFIGTWQGVTTRAISGAKAIESPQWNWDFLTDREQPALVLISKSSPYLRQARLTYQPERRLYRLFVTSANGSERIFEGKFLEQPKDASTADAGLQRSFKLHLVQTTPQESSEALAFRQEHNNRYLLEVYRKSGNALTLYDTVETIREGSGVSIDPAEISQQECVVSGGRGMTSLVFEGKSYLVCCEGCKAAFMADPRRWVEESRQRTAR